MQVPQPVKGSNAKYPLSAPLSPGTAVPHATSYISTGCEVACPPPLPGSPFGPLNACNCSAVKSEYLNGSPLSPFGPLSALSCSCVKSENLNGSPLGPGVQVVPVLLVRRPLHVVQEFQVHL